MDYTTINYTEGFNIASKQSIFAYGSSLEVQRVEAVARRDMESNWVGSQVIVNGKVGRRVGCVVGNDTGYFVFDIDHIEDDDESEPPAPALDDSSDEEESMEMDEDTFQR